MRHVSLTTVYFSWVWLTASAALAAPTAAPNDLLLHRKPLATQGVRRAGVLTDHVQVKEGAPWQTQLNAVFDDGAASVVYDLGQVTEIRAAQVQGDHDDSYAIDGSNDGSEWTPIWRAKPLAGHGMTTRWAADLRARARYVRLTAADGDGRFAVSELMLFDAPLQRSSPTDVADAPLLSRQLRDRTLLFGLYALFPLLVPARSRRIWRLAALLPTLFGTGLFLYTLYQAYPLQSRDVSLIRAVVAFVAAIAVARDALWGRRFAAPRGRVLGILSMCAVLAIAAFYNMGQPQFYDSHLKQWVFAHYPDLRQYYPTAKYFRELGYTRMYDADLAAHLERLGSRDARSLARVNMRDLDTLQIVSGGERGEEIAAAKARFTPERWAEYQHDATWFCDAMGERDYLVNLIDFGGNATPVWMAIAHVLFEWVTPSARAFNSLGLVDLGMLLGAFIAVGLCFGVRTALICAIVFGTNDFVMYGTNWSGATLRHDWMAYLAFGACALKRERYAWGGAFIALSSMIRAFPALAFAGIGAAALWRVAARIRRDGVPSWSELLREERQTLAIAGGALAALVACFAFSSAILGPDAWVEWWAKVSHLESEAHPAKVALRNLLAGAQDQAAIIHDRRALFIAVVGAFALAIVLAARKARPEQAAVLGLMLVPTLLAPANYYLHLVFLFPLLAREQPSAAGQGSWVSAEDARLWLCVLWLCALQYFTVLVPDIGLHFYLSSALLFGCLSALLWCLLRSDADVSTWFARRFEVPTLEVAPARTALRTDYARISTRSSTPPSPLSPSNSAP